MKRFYCTICDRVIRVRRYPSNVSTPNAEQPEQRVGTCKWHDSHRTGTPISKREHQTDFASLSMTKGAR